jgi:hypothetical protein
MPRSWVVAAWESGVREIGLLARIFEVSLDAMRRRLRQLGLVPHRSRHPREILV